MVAEWLHWGASPRAPGDLSLDHDQGGIRLKGGGCGERSAGTEDHQPVLEIDGKVAGAQDIQPQNHVDPIDRDFPRDAGQGRVDRPDSQFPDQRQRGLLDLPDGDILNGMGEERQAGLADE
jgi:hypothetical protein